MENARILVCVADPGLESRVKSELRRLGLEFRVAASPPAFPDRPRDRRFWLVDSDWLARVPAANIQNIVLVAGEQGIPVRALPYMACGNLVSVPSRNLDSSALVEAVRKLASPGARGLMPHIMSVPELAMIPRRVLEVFVHKPAGVQTTVDFAKALAVSRGKVRDTVHACEFERTEYLVTALRAESWIWFARAGVSRKRFEPYLGIYDRTDFRRACRRAGIEVPWNRWDPPSLCASSGI